MSKLLEDLDREITREADAVVSIMRAITHEFELQDFGREARNRVWHQVDKYVVETFLRDPKAHEAGFPHAPHGSMTPNVISSRPRRDDHGESDDLQMGNVSVERRDPALDDIPPAFIGDSWGSAQTVHEALNEEE